MEAAKEMRKDKRIDVTWPVSIWVPDANRFFNGISHDVSRGGAFIVLSMTPAISVGQEVEINFPRTKALAKSKGQCARIKKARIIRVDLKTFGVAYMGMGVQFVDMMPLVPSASEESDSTNQ